jgi:hypothetical protein
MKTEGLAMCITGCTISAKANLEMDNWVTYLQFTIETQDSFKRKLRTKSPSKDDLSLNQKALG